MVMWEKSLGREKDKDSFTNALGVGMGCDATGPMDYENN